MAHDVFVSYATGNKPMADAAIATLENAGVRCWIAPRDIAPGKNYMSSISQAIREARVLVLVFSSAANESPHVMREVQQAVELGLPIVPLRIEDAIPGDSLSYALVGTHWLDAMSAPVEEHLRDLVVAVNALIGHPGPGHDGAQVYAQEEQPAPQAPVPPAGPTFNTAPPQELLTRPQKMDEPPRRYPWLLWPLLSLGLLAPVPFIRAAVKKPTRGWVAIAAVMSALAVLSLSFVLLEVATMFCSLFWIGSTIVSWLISSRWVRQWWDDYEARHGLSTPTASPEPTLV